MDFRKTLLCSLLVAGAAAHAEGLYVVGALGRSDADLKDISKGDLDAAFDYAAESLGYELTSSDLEESDTGYKLQLGYQFSPNFAIEGGYVDLGETTYEFSISDGIDSGSGELAYETTGLNIDALALLPVNSSVSLYGKVGLIFAETEFSGTGLESEDASKTAASIGLGITWNFYDRFSLRGEWQRYLKLGDEDDVGTEVDIDLISAGLAYRF